MAPLQESFPPHHWSQCGPFITPRSFSQHWLHTGKIDPVLRRATIHPIAMTRLLGNVDSRARFQFASRPKPKTEQSTYYVSAWATEAETLKYIDHRRPTKPIQKTTEGDNWDSLPRTHA